MQIEVGKYYRTRDGRKAGPLAKRYHPEFQLQAEVEEFGPAAWRKNGTNIYSQDMDIIAEWSEGPVRTETVTKRSIVPGVYGIVRIKNGRNGNAVDVWLDGSEATGFAHWYTADELDELADTARQLAEALRDGLD